MATWNELLNKVLVRMREDEVTTLDDDYAFMVAGFVQDAVTQVEEAWTWSCLIQDIDVTTIANQSNYSLTGLQQRVIIDQVYTDVPSFLREIPRRKMLVHLAAVNPQSTRPSMYTRNGVDAAGDSVVQFFPVPDDVYNITINARVRSTPFVDLTDGSPVPETPIYLLALAFTARERGEVGGQSAAEYFELAKRSLSDAIALDMAQNPDESVWYV